VINLQQKLWLKIPPHLKRVATVPCEICLQEIFMLKNCMNKLPRTLDSASENCCRKYSSNDVSNM